MKVFKGQTDLTIKLDCNADLTDTTTALIKFKKPSGTTGSWTATVEDIPNGIIAYDVQSGDLDESGGYRLWAHLTNNLGEIIMGEVAKLSVYQEGDVRLVKS